MKGKKVITQLQPSNNTPASDAIIELIRLAFRDVPRPAFTLADAVVSEEWGEERYRFEEHDQRWEDIPDEHVRLAADFASVFLREGELHLLLPRFMIFEIQHNHTDTKDHLIQTLCMASLGFRNSLTPEQRHAIASFLGFLRSRGETDVHQEDIVSWENNQLPPEVRSTCCKCRTPT